MGTKVSRNGSTTKSKSRETKARDIEIELNDLEILAFQRVMQLAQVAQVAQQQAIAGALDRASIQVSGVSGVDISRIAEGVLVVQMND